MEKHYFSGMDLSGLFDSESTFGRNYRFGEVTDELIQRAEELMGYKIPASYRKLLEFQNGGLISEKLSESWLSAIYGISEDPKAFYGLECMFDNWRDGWEYPDIGIPFGETQSAGHDMYYLDFRATDEGGEPRVVRVDNEMGNEVYFVANNLYEFIGMILANEVPEETLIDGAEKIEPPREPQKMIRQDRRPLIVLLAVLDVLLFLLLLITFSIAAARVVILIVMLILTACLIYFGRTAQK
ncbi:MAG: SMI1/KNR4 family protein [Oscillospiraceae bacterium]|nr:SMI1/KNR4 family protein [Oscillospiraceae bacterium]